MNKKNRKEMMSYYNERAREYDELYSGKYSEKRHITIDPGIYQEDVAKIFEFASDFGKGHLIDIACGTGFWLLGYARNCSKITLLDQSEKMLKECSKRVEQLGIVDSVNIIQGDFFEVQLEASTFDSALTGFLLSHLNLDQEKVFFRKLERILKPSGQLMFIDGAWNVERQKYAKKEGIQERTLNDGRKFKIYKRYFSKSDMEEMFSRYNFEMKSYYIGKAMIAAKTESIEKK